MKQSIICHYMITKCYALHYLKTAKSICSAKSCFTTGSFRHHLEYPAHSVSPGVTSQIQVSKMAPLFLNRTKDSFILQPPKSLGQFEDSCPNKNALFYIQRCMHHCVLNPASVQEEDASVSLDILG